MDARRFSLKWKGWQNQLINNSGNECSGSSKTHRRIHGLGSHRSLPIDSSKVGLSPHWTNPQFFYFREQQIMWKSHLPISSSLLMVSYPFHQHLEQCRKRVDAVYTQPCLTAEHKRPFFISKPPSSSKFMACSIHKSVWKVSVCIWNHIKPNIQKSIGLLAHTNQLLENRTARRDI